MKPSCYNRPDFKDAVTVQDGWDCAGCRHNADVTGAAPNGKETKR